MYQCMKDMDKVKTAWKVGYKHQKVSCIQIWNYQVKSAYFLLVNYSKLGDRTPCKFTLWCLNKVIVFNCLICYPKSNFFLLLSSKLSKNDWYEIYFQIVF